MTKERWIFLMESLDALLSPSETEEGWHWCAEFDGLLVGPGSAELDCCHCWPKDHPVYTTLNTQPK